MKPAAPLVFVGVVAAASPAGASPTITSRDVGFVACLATIDQIARQSRSRPIVVVDRPSYRVARIRSAAGLIVVTCDRGRQKVQTYGHPLRAISP